MSETEGQDTGADTIAFVADPLAVALATGGASRERADAFLKKQEALVEDQQKLVQLQAKELAHELKLRHWSLQLRHGSAVLKFALEVSLAIIGIAIACSIGAGIWAAAHADGLIVESFSVPPEMAQRGLTGQVVASQMLDRLAELQSETASARAARSFANDWGDDIKVEIPETGVSFGEAYRYLKQWLGHETHVSGELVRTEGGIALTARVSGNGSATYAGTEAELANLLHKSAENIYRQTQPYRYAVYLESHGRMEEALAIYQHLTTAGAAEDRPWGYIGWSNILLESESPRMGVVMLERALALQPDNIIARGDLEGEEFYLSRPERALQDTKQMLSVGRGGQQLSSAYQIVVARANAEAMADGFLGDFQKAVRERLLAQPVQGGHPGILLYSLARYLTGEHDLAAARAAFITARARLANSAQITPEFFALMGIAQQMVMDSEAKDWAGVAARANDLAPLFQESPGIRSVSLTMTVPLTAYANARLGNIAAAEAAIAPTPDDCYDCLITRARIAELEGQHARADWWFGRAVESNPSIPFADALWGQTALERGQPEVAIEKFKLANQKGPRFADPLEGWGEALMAKNQSHLALAKFEEAEKYAPNWGRLHLKWGEALMYAGHKDEARAQYLKASTLDLTVADKAELVKASAHA